MTEFSESQIHPKAIEPPRDMWTTIRYKVGEEEEREQQVPFVSDEVESLNNGLTIIQNFTTIGARGSSGERDFILSTGSVYPDQGLWTDREGVVLRLNFIAEKAKTYLSVDDPGAWYGFMGENSLEELRMLRDIPEKLHEFGK